MRSVRSPLQEFSSSKINRLVQKPGGKEVGVGKRSGSPVLQGRVQLVENNNRGGKTETPLQSLPKKLSMDGGQFTQSPKRGHGIYQPSSRMLATPTDSDELIMPNTSTTCPGSYKKQVEIIKARLQLAYYKYRTNQSHLNFRELKQRHMAGKSVRKLACTTNSCSLRTPVKPASASIVQKQPACLSPSNTPMSVKAAKSLLQLLSASSSVNSKNKPTATPVL
ncbi:Nrm1p Ecym_2119 [Eremothecium cymbalariae DBVPG|uniref:Uncharacterized protein n=1 Tax=Eremothecium cymbalariae (strain CBS 270.75 / DBVPG 7215 / KCTC 17166 / NRRL Y-17582) TaxID=931890 RepID=G8JPM3_ERECY|nr:Hypothetical protein Ecym_2119 [Eremothecium cymbalariae DBVPG\